MLKTWYDKVVKISEKFQAVTVDRGVVALAAVGADVNAARAAIRYYEGWAKRAAAEKASSHALHCAEQQNRWSLELVRALNNLDRVRQLHAPTP